MSLVVGACHVSIQWAAAAAAKDGSLTDCVCMLLAGTDHEKAVRIRQPGGSQVARSALITAITVQHYQQYC